MRVQGAGHVRMDRVSGFGRGFFPRVRLGLGLGLGLGFRVRLRFRVSFRV